MKKPTSKSLRLPLVSAIAAALLPVAMAPAVANAQESADLEEVVITGVRGKPRTVQDSPVPVDVFSQEDLENVEFTDMNDIIRTLVPTYNLSRQPISDGATFIRPATLRGLPTDKTLVLVNGKRRHRAALVLIGGAGSQGPDLATIPAAAIGGLEILRDGAAALYGSDAIAGVMNFQLKNNDSGGSISVTTGQYYENDGDNTTVSGNMGFSIGDGGFLSVSAEHYTADPTYRGEQYCRSVFCLDPTGAAYDDFIANGDPRRVFYGTDPDFLAATANASLDGPVVQPWGNPNAERSSIFFNAGMPMSDTVDMYAFGNYSQSTGDGSFFYRYPYNGVIEELREPDGSIYFPLEKHPGGFTPRFFGDVKDKSLAVGWNNSDEGRFGWDASVRMGESTIDYTLKNTINPSMGPDSPTSFRPGRLTNTEMQFQLDLSYELTDTVTVLGGLSQMDEEYDIAGGEPDSYRVGPYSSPDPWSFCNDDGTPTAAGAAVVNPDRPLDCSDPDDPVYTAVGVGSNGFPGYSPAFSDVYSRDSFAAYGEVNADVTDKLFVQAALRYEDYSDFGSETIYKVAGNLQLSDTLRMRASVNTGFRAPTPGQQGTTNVSTRLPDGVPIAVGLFPAGGTVAQALGSSGLKPETSNGFSIGLTGSAGGADFTIDYYSIDVDDYFNAVSTRDVSSTPGADGYDNFLALDAAGVAGANTIGGVNWFTNAYDVGVSGIDAVVTYPIDSNFGTTDLTFTYGYNEFEFKSSPDGFLSSEAQHDTVNFNPNTRFILQANHRMNNNFAINARGSYWGESSNAANSNDDSPIQDFSSIFMLDLSVSYMGDGYTLTAGGMNITDEYPDRDNIGDYCCGRIYPSASGISWQGGRWYVKAEYMF